MGPILAGLFFGWLPALIWIVAGSIFFGATNQLLAGLALLAVTVWLKRTGRQWAFAALPMVFMLVMTMTAIVMLIAQNGLSLLGMIASALFVLGVLLAIEAARASRLKELGPEPVILRPAGAMGD
ncbi:MAG: carbon starvation CstA 5TM domain-containing protein [Gemmatimonadota bacterium]